MASIFIELLFRNVELNPSLIQSSFSLFKCTTPCAFRVLLLKKLLLVQLHVVVKGSNYHFKSLSSLVK